MRIMCHITSLPSSVLPASGRGQDQHPLLAANHFYWSALTTSCSDWSSSAANLNIGPLAGSHSGNMIRLQTLNYTKTISYQTCNFFFLFLFSLRLQSCKRFHSFLSKHEHVFSKAAINVLNVV